MKLGYWFAVCVVTTAAIAFCADQPKKDDKPKPPPPKAYLTPEEGGIAFKLQGEYEGEAEGGKLGVQVIALKDGAFRAVIYGGGLPGAGWDGKTKTEIDGRLQGEKAVFTGKTSASADGSVFAGTTADGKPFSLKKVMRQSPTLGAKPPAGAIVLFDGTNLNEWKPGAKMDDEKRLMALSNPTTVKEFKDFSMHIEFLLPFMPDASGQGRANSGVYVQGRYEIQVLDSFGLRGADNECGGIYRNAAPLVNMCLPPLSWQTYDIDFTAAKYDGDNKIANAVITVRHNGVVIHDKLELKGPTPGGPKSDPKKFPESTPGPLYLQNHGNPVLYRNIWVVPK